MREQLAGLKKASPADPTGTSLAATETKPALPLGEQDRLTHRQDRKTPGGLRAGAGLASIANIVIVEIMLAPDTPPARANAAGRRRAASSNPLPFHVGQVAEIVRKPMISARIQVLGKEELSLRKRPDDEAEQRITLPCTVNGQIASGEMNRYRFTARKGQHLVLTTTARQLVPYIADAVPGWFQPVLALYDARGKELAYDDDDRFKPDPVIRYRGARDGEYTFTITDALYRGREDFVYRVTIGELPLVCEYLPAGPGAGTAGGNRHERLEPGRRRADPAPGYGRPGHLLPGSEPAGRCLQPHPLCARCATGSLGDGTEQQPGDGSASEPPVIINGRIDRKDDLDVFSFAGKAGETVVAEVTARRLDSSLDSFLKLTGPDGKILAFNDDHADPAAGLNTHDADSYLMTTLPADGTYRVCVGDVDQSGGDGYGYRLRISPPQPDFALILSPSSITLRTKGGAPLTVHVIRKDGFAGPIKLTLKDPPEGLSALPATVPANKDVATLRLRTTLTATNAPIAMGVQGLAHINGHDVVRRAIPAEDRMQAFLWRHLVPASDLSGHGLQPGIQTTCQCISRVVVPIIPAPAKQTASTAAKPEALRGKQQARRRSRGNPSSPSSRWPVVCGSSRSSLKTG